MACKTTYVLQKDANKNILGDLSHEDYTVMMLSHTKETLMREYRFRHYMETILPIKNILQTMKFKQLIPGLENAEFELIDGDENKSNVKSNIPYEQLKVYTDIHLIGSPNWVRVATSPINDGVVLITYFNGYGKDAMALKDEYINFKVAKNYDFFQISIANFLVTGESVMSVRLH